MGTVGFGKEGAALKLVARSEGTASQRVNVRRAATVCTVALLAGCAGRSTPPPSSRPSSVPSQTACATAPQTTLETIAHGARHGESTLRALGGGATVKQSDGSVLVAMRFTLQEWSPGRVETGVWRIGPHTDQPNVYAVNEPAMLYSSWPPFPLGSTAVARATDCLSGAEQRTS